MDINPESKTVSLDLTRELLIEISQSLPDNPTNPRSGKEPLSNAHGVSAVENGDSVEKLRSQLISISYVPTPDKFVLPAMNIHE